ncbi:hypothetical protein JG688_00010437, partial [Phytophthora aleatoria]
QNRLETTLRFRTSKKQELTPVRAECEYLEQEVKQRLQVFEGVNYMVPKSNEEIVRTVCRVAHPNGSGWRVHFPNGEPSFYFSPFTRSEYDLSFDVCGDRMASDLPFSSINCRLFGWNVCHASLHTTICSLPTQGS